MIRQKIDAFPPHKEAFSLDRKVESKTLCINRLLDFYRSAEKDENFIQIKVNENKKNYLGRHVMQKLENTEEVTNLNWCQNMLKHNQATTDSSAKVLAEHTTTQLQLSELINNSFKHFQLNLNMKEYLQLDRAEQLLNVTKTLLGKNNFQVCFGFGSFYDQPLVPIIPQPAVKFERGAYVQDWLDKRISNIQYIYPPEYHSGGLLKLDSDSSSSEDNENIIIEKLCQQKARRPIVNKGKNQPVQIIVGPPEFFKAMGSKISDDSKTRKKSKSKRARPKFDDSYSSLENLENWEKKKGLRAGPDATPFLILNEKKRLKKMRRNCSDIDLYKNLQSLDKLLTALYKKMKFFEDKDSGTSSETRHVKKNLRQRRRKRRLDSLAKETKAEPLKNESDPEVDKLKDKIKKFREDMLNRNNVPIENVKNSAEEKTKSKNEKSKKK